MLNINQEIPSLKYLNLNGNKIMDISFVNKLESLTELSLANNQVA